MFGIQFLFNQSYQKENGNGARAVFTVSLLSGLVGVVFLTAVNRFQLEYTPFTLLCALGAALNSLLYSLCALKSLSRINLSLYSLLAMLGGMLLPFFTGLLFYDEPMTAGKGVCVALVIGALLLTLRRETGKGGGVYYCGVFLLNGMSGVIAKIFSSAPYEKASAASFSVWSALITVAFSAVALTVLYAKRAVKRPSGKACGLALGAGALSQIANYMLLLALAVLPSSMQYPFVTGGVMIVSTLIAALTGQKPSRREYASVALAFAGILALVLL